MAETETPDRTAASRRRRLPRSIGALVWLAPALLAAHAATFWGRGVIDREAMAFVLNYLADRPPAAVIFDPSLNDWGAYQARELSYLVDWFDAHVLAGLYSAGVLLFVPASGVVGLAALMLAYAARGPRLLGIDRTTAALLLAWFASTIVVQASTGIFYRSAKILTAVLLLLFLFQILTLIADDRARGPSGRAFALLFGLGVAMSLADRQGLFFLALILAMFAIWLAGSPRAARPGPRTTGGIAGACLAAIASAEAYNRIVAPWLVVRLNGYRPDFGYQRLDVEGLRDPLLWRQSVELLERQAGFLLGNIPPWAAGGIVVVGCAWHVVRRWRQGRPLRPVARDATLAIAAAGGLILMTALMIQRHPPVFSVPDHSYWYYYLAADVLALAGASLVLGRLDLRRSPWRVGLWLLLGFIALTNLSRYPAQRAAMLASSWFSAQAARSERTLDGHDQLAAGRPDAGSVPRWVTVEPFGGSLRLPVAAEDHYPDSLEAALATRAGRMPLAQASGPMWPSLRSFFFRETSPLGEMSQLGPALRAWRENGIRQVVVEPDRYADPAIGWATIEAIRTERQQVIGEERRGPVVRFALADAPPPYRASGPTRPIPADGFTLDASHDSGQLALVLDGSLETAWSTGGAQAGDEWIAIAFDTTRDVAGLRLFLHREAFGDYPRALRIESEAAGRRTILYEGSGLPPLVRGVLRDNFLRTAVEIDFPPNRTDVLRIHQTGRTAERPWTVHELAVWTR